MPHGPKPTTIQKNTTNPLPVNPDLLVLNKSDNQSKSITGPTDLSAVCDTSPSERPDLKDNRPGPPFEPSYDPGAEPTIIDTPTPRNFLNDQISAPFEINSKYLSPPAPDPTDPYEDFGLKVIDNKTDRDDVAWMPSVTNKYHLILRNSFDLDEPLGQPTTAPSPNTSPAILSNPSSIPVPNDPNHYQTNF